MLYKLYNAGFDRRDARVRRAVERAVEEQGGFDARNGGSGAGYIMNEGADDGGWLPTEQYSDAWQSTLFRLFGNTEFPIADDGLV